MSTFPHTTSLLKYGLILTTILAGSTLSDLCLAEFLTVMAEGEYLLDDMIPKRTPPAWLSKLPSITRWSRS